MPTEKRNRKNIVVTSDTHQVFKKLAALHNQTIETYLSNVVLKNLTSVELSAIFYLGGESDAEKTKEN